MPIDGSGSYSLPAGYIATAGTTILTTQHNPIFEDVATALTACVKSNGSKVMTGLLTLSGDPSTALHAATKQYVDAQALAAVAGLDIKPSVTMASTGNVALTAEQTIDGVLTSASRILLKNQTAPAENGIWLTGSGAWSRVTDMDAWTEVPGAVVVVESGTLWADTVWMCTANAGGTINTTAITWRRIDNQPLRNAQVGTTYTVTTDDHGRHITTSNGSAIATTLPQATTTFGNGFEFLIENLGAGANTITPTTSTINGAATLILRTGDVYKVTSDGTNYRALPHGLTYAQLVGLTADGTGATGDLIVTGDISATNLKQMTLATTQTLFAASQAQQETGSSTAVNVTPGRQHFHPSAAKYQAAFDASSGTPTLLGTGFNHSSYTDNGVGDFTVNVTTSFSGATYVPAGITQRPATNSAGMLAIKQGTAPTASALRIATTDNSAAFFDSSYSSVTIHGDL